jgi:predicted unusual protein kinase regulating ubiquinone biosynthesis (AarF/ABC1/UbiB family)
MSECETRRGDDTFAANGGLTVTSYRTTLNTKSTIDDEEKQDQMLKACHKRCAERTLKVLEKNGGIFIKLGQHLVSATILNSIGRHLNG